MEFLAQAGYKTNQILDATPGLLDLATVGKMELAEAADIASNVLGGFGMQASETSKVVDLLSKASVSGNVDVTMLGEAFAKAGPPFKNAGQSIESLAASLDILGNAGVQGSEAGTHLRAMMLRMASGQADGAVNELCVSVKDAGAVDAGTLACDEAGLLFACGFCVLGFKYIGCLFFITISTGTSFPENFLSFFTLSSLRIFKERSKKEMRIGNKCFWCK